MNCARQHTDGVRAEGSTTEVFRAALTDRGLVPLPSSLPEAKPMGKTESALRAAGYVEPVLITSRATEDEWAEMDRTIEAIRPAKADAVDSIMHDLCKPRPLHAKCPSCDETRADRFNRKSIAFPEMDSAFCDDCHDEIAAVIEADERTRRQVEIASWVVVGIGSLCICVPWVVGVCWLAGWLWGAP